MEPGEFRGTIRDDFEGSVPWWPERRRPAPGAPNVVLVVLDDVGFAQLGCFGSDIATPTLDRLAGAGSAVHQLPHHRVVLPHPVVPAHRT